MEGFEHLHYLVNDIILDASCHDLKREDKFDPNKSNYCCYNLDILLFF